MGANGKSLRLEWFFFRQANHSSQDEKDDSYLNQVTTNNVQSMAPSYNLYALYGGEAPNFWGS